MNTEMFGQGILGDEALVAVQAFMGSITYNNKIYICKLIWENITDSVQLTDVKHFEQTKTHVLFQTDFLPSRKEEQTLWSYYYSFVTYMRFHVESEVVLTLDSPGTHWALVNIPGPVYWRLWFFKLHVWGKFQ